VDKEPLGLKKEILPTLQWFKRCRPDTRSILGLRDVMDDADTVKKDWRAKKVYEHLENLYSEIWIYGIQEFYNPITEYEIPESVSRKMHFTGYIPRKIPGKDAVRNVKKELKLKNGEKLVVVTTGGGGDGYRVMDTFLSTLESFTNRPPFKSVLITGPFMPKHERKDVFRRARRLGVRTYHFYRQMEKIFAAADIVISMGGYNTLCEILSQGTISLVIPRETPRQEQVIRARAFHRQNLVDYIPWADYAPDLLRDKIFALLENPAPYREAISQFKLTGIETMQKRLVEFRCKKA
jgi:predicted glycosyltransferase